MLFTTANPLHRLMAHSPARIASLLQLCSMRGLPTMPSNQPLCRFAAAFTSLHVTMPPSALSLAGSPPPCLQVTTHTRSFLTLPGMDAELSKKHRERRLVGYAPPLPGATRAPHLPWARWSPQQLYNVVTDVDHYHEFVPWCQRSVVTLHRDDSMEAELEVGFRMFVERYTSHITLHPGKSVHSRVSNSTLFEYLDCLWEFSPGPTPSSCWLTFRIDFAFKSPLYRSAATMFFEEVVQRMLGAFQARAASVYGPSSLVRRKPAAVHA